MTLKETLKRKLDQLDQKVNARLAVHDMEPKLKKMYTVRQSFQKVGQKIDERMAKIERMKAKIDEMEAAVEAEKVSEKPESTDQ